MCPGVWILTEYSFRGKMLEIPLETKRDTPIGVSLISICKLVSYLFKAVATSTAQATLNLPLGCYRFRVPSCELCV